MDFEENISTKENILEKDLEWNNLEMKANNLGKTQMLSKDERRKKEKEFLRGLEGE